MDITRFRRKSASAMGRAVLSPSEGPFPFLVTLLRRLGIPVIGASVEDLGSVCIEHMILSCLGDFMPLRCSVLNLAIVDVIIRGQSNSVTRGFLKV
ncbi:hypothetical protein TNCV_1253401 [Trichonephila clavipes]|nr:hypothetical protein TNCV_1253401 [Trichonephila clavipes]